MFPAFNANRCSHFRILPVTARLVERTGFNRLLMIVILNQDHFKPHLFNDPKSNHPKKVQGGRL